MSHNVTSVDVDEKKVVALMQFGISPIYKADLDDLTRKLKTTGGRS